PEQAQRAENAAPHFTRRRREREQPAWPETQRLEVAGHRGQAVPAEPAKQLLRAVRRHHEAEHDPRDEQSCIRHRSPPEPLHYTLYSYNLSSSYLGWYHARSHGRTIG